MPCSCTVKYSKSGPVKLRQSTLRKYNFVCLLLPALHSSNQKKKESGYYPASAVGGTGRRSALPGGKAVFFEGLIFTKNRPLA